MAIINLTFLSCVVISINLNIGLKTTEVHGNHIIYENECNVESVILKTERVEKKRNFLFWTLRHRKVIVTDWVEDSKGTKLFEKKSVFICSMDACDERRFRGIRINNNEIWIFKNGKGGENGYIKRYGFCKKYLGRKEWRDGDYYKN